jgi:3',5'-cyclic-AMP phosphodiesterase
VEAVGLRLLHLSDTHFCQGETIPGVDPVANLATFFGELVDRRLDIDACVITGDLAHSGEEWAYRRLRLLLNSVPWPTRVVPGNHDVADLGRRLVGFPYWPDDDVWSWQVSDGFALIGLNSAVPGYHHGSLSIDSLASVEGMAKAASQQGEWLLALHHPPLEVGHWWMDGQKLLNGSDALLAIADRFKAVAILCGHLHTTGFIQRPGRTPVLVAPGTAHEVLFDDGLERPLRFRRRSPRALLHKFSSERLTTVELTAGGASWLVDGHPWEEERQRTNSRGPARQ